MDNGVALAIKAIGRARLAEGLGISRAAVSQWKRIPAARVLDVERLSSVPRYMLRPDLYPVHDYAKGFLKEGSYDAD